MQEIKSEQVAEQSEELDLFGAEVTPEALEQYMHANYSTSAQASLFSALALLAA